MAVKKGDMVKAIEAKLNDSLEAKASDTRWSSYLFESQGEVLELNGDYALVKFGVTPLPNVWLRQDQLESWS